MQDLTQDNLSEIIEKNTKVVVQYSLAGVECRIMKPKFKRFSTEFNDAVFVMVDAEKYPESRKLATVDNLPTFATFKNGALVNQIQTNKADVLKSFIDETTNN